MKACHETTDGRWIDTCSSPQFEVLMRIYPDRRRITSYFVPLGRNPVDRLAVKAFMTLQPLHKKLHDRRAVARHPDPAEVTADATPAPDVVSVEPVPLAAPTPTPISVEHRAPATPTSPSDLVAAVG
jgi:hypothetical protein